MARQCHFDVTRHENSKTSLVKQLKKTFHAFMRRNANDSATYIHDNQVHNKNYNIFWMKNIIYDFSDTLIELPVFVSCLE